MLRQILRRRGRILKGFCRPYARRHQQQYEPHVWWDEAAFNQGVSDRQTISSDKKTLTACYHYASVELLLLRHLCTTGVSLQGRSVCDLGSGAGHWIDFFQSIGASRCIGIDISRKAVDFLMHKYSGNDSVAIHHGSICDVLPTLSEPVDLVNAIGVMFHIVDDGDWERAIRQVAQSLNSGGLFVVGGHFGWLNNVNVQFDGRNRVNKRLRSASQWRRSLRNAGLGKTRICRNNAFMFIDDWIPENNLLVARKP